VSITLDAAVAMAEAGWSIFPCHWPIRKGGAVACSCSDGACGNAGKHPRTRHGLLDATADAETVVSYWRRFPEANIGLATGEKNNITVLDVDPGHGGVDSLLILTTRHGELPETLRSRTGSGGEHIIFRHVTGVRNSTAKLGAGLDVRGEGGYIIAPPSLHPSGGRYQWLQNISPAPAPGWLVAELAVNDKATEPVGEYRECMRLDRYGEAALASATSNILNAPRGLQEHTLNSEAYSIGRKAAAGYIPRKLAIDMLVIAAKGLKTLDPQRPWHPGQAKAKAKASFEQGLLKPYPSPEQLEAERQRKQDEWAQRLAAGETFYAG
jgi:hypothetical protein